MSAQTRPQPQPTDDRQPPYTPGKVPPPDGPARSGGRTPPGGAQEPGPATDGR